ncbi:uncharacterized protein SETTUDRAFT_162965 [Exserohilum turcica Et28A]|uniref:Uncharacterized protein n=1 Tax=Exserohilum turcicum (strain 28A) TaxID=671987 RepID=R0IQ25_EXST2|nr:uncharacterized protein SETTUDRAFT_162965 [Exserohilum turcica Et28A]EOA86826.1 hypothetical protein SETTUDRAFT_162965 [Exserohilum turcica Et28A]
MECSANSTTATTAPGTMRRTTTVDKKRSRVEHTYILKNFDYLVNVKHGIGSTRS